jgi:hypothetical protein
VIDTKTGIWDLETANSHGGHKHDLPLLDEICKLYTPTRVADLGCGDGWYCANMKKAGYKVVHGYEGCLDMRKISLCDELFIMDLSEPQLVAQKYDFVLCLEVGEHIPKSAEQVFLDNVVKFCSKDLVLSWAIPGQGGRGHFNEQPNDYIISQICNRGFVLNQAKTDLLRAASTLKWFKNTIGAYELG